MIKGHFSLKCKHFKLLLARNLFTAQYDIYILPVIILPSRYIYLLIYKQKSYQSSRELSRTYQQFAGVITKFSQHLNDNSCEDDKRK